jgi:hypothetical protein
MREVAKVFRELATKEEIKSTKFKKQKKKKLCQEVTKNNPVAILVSLLNILKTFTMNIEYRPVKSIFKLLQHEALTTNDDSQIDLKIGVLDLNLIPTNDLKSVGFKIKFTCL